MNGRAWVWRRLDDPTRCKLVERPEHHTYCVLDWDHDSPCLLEAKPTVTPPGDNRAVLGARP